MPNNQRQHRTLQMQKEVLPYALCLGCAALHIVPPGPVLGGVGVWGCAAPPRIYPWSGGWVLGSGLQG